MSRLRRSMEKSSKPAVRIAIVGSSGFIGRTHIRHVLEENDSELAALIDTSPSASTDADKLNVPHFMDIEQCLTAYRAGAIALDAVVLATPTQTHATMAHLFEGSGLAVLIEKPLSSNGQDGKTLSALKDRDTRGVYMVGHHRRHSAYVRAIKDVLDANKLGDVVAINGVWAMRKSETYFDIPWHTQVGAGGVILTNAIHDLDMLQYWLGDIAEVFAVEGPKTRPYDVDSTVQITLKFSSGVVGSFLLSDSSAAHQSWDAGTGDNPVFSPTGADFLTIFGTEGSISLPSLVRHHYENRSENERNWNFPLETDSSAKDMLDGVPAFHHQLKHFIAASRREVEPDCSVEDGLRAVLVTEAVFKSLETGRSIAVERVR